MDISELISRHRLVSEQVSSAEIGLVLEQLQHVCEQQVAGSVLEFGCYNGTTSLFIQRYLEAVDPKRPYHVYDSFAGLPEKSAPDQSPAGEQFKPGTLQVSKAAFVRNFRQAGLRLPVIHKAWFEQLGDHDVPAPIAFAFLDGDYYNSISASLQLIEAKLSQGAIIVVDDYQSEALPGAAKAVDHWLRRNVNYRLKVQASLAILQSPR